MLPNNSETFVLGICGGSASGKTHVASHLVELLFPVKVSVLDQDSYYHDSSKLSLERRSNLNFDHPEAIDFDQFVKDLRRLKLGTIIDKPQYDFNTHSRRDESLKLKPTKILIVEGLHIFHVTKVADLIDLKIFVDVDSDIRLARRLIRDVQARGRTYKSVLDQYFESVRPMDLEFVQPYKHKSDIIIKQENYDESITQILNQLSLDRAFEEN